MVRGAGEESVAALLALAESQDLRHRAEEACRVWLRSAAAEDGLRGWTLGDIEPRFDRCMLVFDHSVLDYPFFEMRFGLYVSDPGGNRFRDLRPVGHYRLITRLDGTPDDDYFVLDIDKHAEPVASADGAA
ncbi:MAG: hypothetical protein ABL962_13690 [Fimbriimonadaceae bacterium]